MSSRHQQAVLQEIARLQGGTAAGGQGNAHCPICDEKKFRFSFGTTGYLVICCQSGPCREPSMENLDPSWLRRAQDVLVGKGIPANLFRAPSPQRSGPPVPDLPTEEALERLTDNLLTALDRGRFSEHTWLTAGVAADACLGFDLNWDNGLGRLVCPVYDPEAGVLQTVIYRSLSGAKVKSRIHKGSHGRYLYAPLGLDDDEPVLLVGGEKDVLVALAHGWRNVACFTNGDGPPGDPSRAEALRGRSVVLAGDIDATKKTHQLATFLLDVAADVRVADLSIHATTLPPNGDVADLLMSAGLGRGALRKLISSASTWDSKAAESTQRKDRLEVEAERIRVQREARRLVDAEEANRTAVVLPRLTLADALSEERPPRPPQRIAGLHEVDHNTTITAQYKTGKTTLGGNLIRSLVDGDDFLDRFEVVQPSGRVGLLNYELSEADMLDWLEDQDILKLDRVAVLNLRGVPFSLASEQHQTELIEWCDEMEVEVLHLDPHRRALKGFGSENSNDDVNAFTDVLDTVKREAGVRDLFLYVHSGRALAEMGTEHARGATALDDWTDNRWVLTKNGEGDRFLYADGRTGYMPEFTLTFDRVTRRLSAQDGNRRESAILRHRDPVLSVLEVVGVDGVNTGQLEERLGIGKKGDTSKVLDRLVQEGLVVRVKKGNAVWNYLSEHAPKDKS